MKSNECCEKRILILGSLIEFVDLVKTAKERGYYTVCCDGYQNGPAKAFADKSYVIDVRNVEAIVEICRKECINGIIASFSDLLFEQITKIAAKANLKWYATPEKLKYYREKNEAKKLLEQMGIRVPKHCSLNRNFSDEELNGFTFPLVIKPINGYGSKGIFVVSSIEEIREKFDQVVCRAHMGLDSEIEVEEYSMGREYNFQTWLVDGEIFPISLGDREKNPQEGDTIPILNRRVYPSKNITNVLPLALDVLKKFASAVGQKNGPLSMQFFFNENGVEVCEIAGRLFAYEHEIIEYCSGLKIENLLLDYVYEEKNLKELLRKHSAFFKKNCAALYFLGIQDKVIKDKSVIYELEKDSHVIKMTDFYRIGDKIDNYGPNPYLVRYYLTAETREELDSVTEKFFQEMSVIANDGSELSKKFILDKRV